MSEANPNGSNTPRAASKRGRFARAFYWRGWKTVGAVATSAVAISTAIVAVATFFVAERTLGVSQQTLQANTRQQTSDRFGKEIEHLGSDNPDVRLGGIYALDHLARDATLEHPDVYNVLTSFVRGHSCVAPRVVASSPAPSSPAPSSLASSSLASSSTRPSEDIQTPTEDIQTVIYLVGRRDRKDDAVNESVDFSHTCLRGAHFEAVETSANYSGISMNDADLQGANLGKAKLDHVTMYGATLDRAVILGADLSGATLSYARAEQADFYEANLSKAQIQHTDLREANLNKADLQGADLRSTNLLGANLLDANLTDALYDTATIWPSGYQPPPSAHAAPNA